MVILFTLLNNIGTKNNRCGYPYKSNVCTSWTGSYSSLVAAVSESARSRSKSATVNGL